MITLEALPAKHGDCFLLHFDRASDQPDTVLIDGGPSGVWLKALKPRLERLRQERGLASGETLRFPLALVTHVDDDHITVLLDLVRSIPVQTSPAFRPYGIDDLWLNHFEDVLGASLPLSEAAVTASAAPFVEGGASRSGRVLASIGQGRALRDEARGRGIRLNGKPGQAHHPSPPILAGSSWTRGSLILRVVAPTQARLRALREAWEKDVRAHPPKQIVTAACHDQSVYNLSSLVVLAESEGRRVLLTGDARGDEILEGLKAAGLLDAGGGIDVDILKLPHHGSINNVDLSFFEKVRARHYVVSGDRKRFPNPSPDTFALLVQARPSLDFTVWLTYALPEVTQIPALSGLRFKTPASPDASLVIDPHQV